MSDIEPFASLLILSGGVGERSKHTEPKQFYEIAGHPMVAHSIIAALRESRFGEIIINAPEGYEERTAKLVAAYCGSKPHRVVAAGSTRQKSARILAEAARYDTVVLHEAARPFVDLPMYKRLLDSPAPNVGYYHAIPFSMCKIDAKTRLVKKGVSREKVFNIQLPHKFSRADLLKAHEAAEARNISYNEDTVMVVQEKGADVLALDGISRNIKVTTPEDFVIAEQLFRCIVSRVR